MLCSAAGGVNGRQWCSRRELHTGLPLWRGVTGVRELDITSAVWVIFITSLALGVSRIRSRTDRYVSREGVSRLHVKSRRVTTIDAAQRRGCGRGLAQTIYYTNEICGANLGCHPPERPTCTPPASPSAASVCVLRNQWPGLEAWRRHRAVTRGGVLLPHAETWCAGGNKRTQSSRYSKRSKNSGGCLLWEGCSSPKPCPGRVMCSSFSCGGNFVPRRRALSNLWWSRRQMRLTYSSYGSRSSSWWMWTRLVSSRCSRSSGSISTRGRQSDRSPRMSDVSSRISACRKRRQALGRADGGFARQVWSVCSKRVRSVSRSCSGM